MFLQNNTYQEVMTFFRTQLGNVFTSSEISQMVKILMRKRLCLSEHALLDSQQKFSESDLLFFRSVIKRLQSKEPFQYIIGETFFYNIALKVDKRALIPRPETVELVDWIVNDIASNKLRNPKILDIGTGSGCIPLALKNIISEAEVHGMDVSKEALQLAKENAAALNLAVSWCLQDIIANDLKFPADYFDIIVSNPPYIPISEKQAMARHVIDYEPELALFVEESDPLLFYKVIAKNAKRNLKKGASLYFELHEDYAADAENFIKKLNFEQVTLKKDLQGKYRMLKAIK